MTIAAQRVPVPELSILAQALLRRSHTVARIVCDAYVGSPQILRATAARYAEAATELHATGHEDAATLLDVFGATALRNARLIETGVRNIRQPHWLRGVHGERG